VLSSIMQDLRYGLRALLRSPGFTLPALIILALGIGANTAVFSVVNGVLLRPLPYPDADRLVAMWTLEPGTGDMWTVSTANYADWDAQNQVFESTYAWTAGDRTITDREERLQVRTAIVTERFFDVTGVRPALGRGFREGEVGEGTARRAVLSHGLWQRLTGGNTGVIGSTIELDGVAHEVIGVAAAGFTMPRTEEVNVWVTFDIDLAAGERDMFWLAAVGRLKDGVSLEAARADMDAVHGRLRAEYPAETEGTAVALIPLKSDLVADVQGTLRVLLGAVGLVLILACANVANLFLSRSATREGELSVRAALGARRGRLVRLVVTEGLIVSSAAAAVGSVIAIGAVGLISSLAPEDLPRISDVSVDLTALGVTVGLALLTGLLFGLAPALHAARRDPAEALRERSRGAVGGRRMRRVRDTLVVAEVSLAVVLLIGAGLLVRSFAELMDVDPGFEAKSVAAAGVLVPRDVYTDAYQRAAFYDGLTEHVRSVPGVESVGGVWNAPMGSAVINLGVLTDGSELGPDENRPPAEFRIATGDYFETLGIPLVDGRTFGPEDVRDAPHRVVISALLAEKLWPGESAIGHRLSADAFEENGEPNWMEVVGVVGDVRLNGLDDPERGVMYQAYSQRPQARMTLTIRTAGDPSVMTDALRSAILEYEPRTPVPEFETMETRVQGTVAGRQFFLALLGTFAGIALLLACVGVYGVLSYSVSRRTREIGVRAAFGASRGRILGLVVRQGMSVVVLGVGIGVLGAWGASRVMTSMVFGISPTDPGTYAGISLGVLLTA